MKRIVALCGTAFLALLGACATIPQESVDLSTELGIGLQKQYQVQVDLVNLFFATKRRDVDTALGSTIEVHFGDLASDGPISLNQDQLHDVATDIIDYNETHNATKEGLEKARLLLIKNLNEDYLALSQGNSSLTNLLQSAVGINEARTEALDELSAAAGRRIDLNAIFAEVDKYILDVGEGTGNLLNQLESMLASEEKN